MATNNRGGSRGGNQNKRETAQRSSTSSRGESNRNRSNERSSRRSSSESRGQYGSGLLSTAKDRPFAAAATIGGAVAAGVFLWSRRNQISEQIADLSDQLSEWREGLGSDDSDAGEFGSTGGDSFMARSGRGGRRSQSDIAEEALTLKETGRKTKRGGADASLDEQTQAGAIAY